MIKRRSTILAVTMASIMLAGWATWAAPGQGVAAPRPAEPTRFEFLVVESFDARYFQDTPGHLGRAASGRVAPRIALFDPVMRGTTKVGEVSHLEWNEARESLEVEFNPEKNIRICIGDAIWISVPTN